MYYELNGTFKKCYSVTICYDDRTGKTHKPRTVWFHSYKNAHAFYAKRDSELRNDPNVRTVFGAGVTEHELPDCFQDDVKLVA